MVAWCMGWYDNPIPTTFLGLIDCFKIPAQNSEMLYTAHPCLLTQINILIVKKLLWFLFMFYSMLTNQRSPLLSLWFHPRRVHNMAIYQVGLISLCSNSLVVASSLWFYSLGIWEVFVVYSIQYTVLTSPPLLYYHNNGRNTVYTAIKYSNI
jgi:hypothetical protein